MIEKAKGKITPILIAALFVGGGAIFVSKFIGGGKTNTVSVKVPPLSKMAGAGASLFNANCASCHGPNGSGSDSGPPLIHKIYHPGHHGDASFLFAAKNGTRAHHWKFGDMPPVEGVTEPDVLKIVRYVRELQKANGIF